VHSNLLLEHSMDNSTALQTLQSYAGTLDEQQALKDTIALITDTDAPFSDEQFVPGHITASGFVVDPEHRAMLLIHHGKLGIWVQPGGHVELVDATLEAAARREVVEETAVRLSDREGLLFDVDAHEIPQRGDKPAHVHFDVRFAFEALSHHLARSHEVRDATWVGFDDVLCGPYQESVKRPATKLLTMVMNPMSPFYR
jgi:ADP-ribose pyrophosphatase YjhB (NUDIX family)